MIKEKRKSRKIVFSVVTIIVAIMGYYFFQARVLNIKNSSNDSFYKSILVNIKMAQNKYFEEYSEYSGNSKKIGFDLISEEYRVYFASEEVPTLVLASISEDNRPFIKKNSYRAILIPAEGDVPLFYWVMEDSSDPKKIIRH